MSTNEFYLCFTIDFFFLLPKEVFVFRYIEEKKELNIDFQKQSFFFIKIQKVIYCSTEENAIPFLVVGSH